MGGGKLKGKIFIGVKMSYYDEPVRDPSEVGYKEIVMKDEMNPARLDRDLSSLPSMTDDEWRLRRIIALSHSSCDGRSLYGDDGELYCWDCGIDFMRDSAAEIEKRISDLNLMKVIKEMGEEK